MARRADINIADTVAAQWSGAGTNYIVQTVAGVYYMVYIDSALDVSFKKSTDGMTWSQATLAATAGTTTQLAVWYDRWSGIASDYILFAFTDSGNDDTFFRTINTASSDALSTQTVVYAGASTAGGGHLSIVRSVGGNTYVKTIIDAGAEGDFYRLPVANFPDGAWDLARTIDEGRATLDQIILLPDLTAADTQDIMAVFQDASVTETTRKLYDDSGNSWAEASINNAITELATSTAFANLATAVDLTNDLVVLVVWTNTDTLNADLKCYTVTNAAITAVTDVVLNSTDDQGLCAISIDAVSGWWYVFYCGKSDGSETWNTALKVYMKVSKDAGSNWGPETLVSVGATATIRHLYTCPWLYTGQPVVAWVVDAQTDDLKFSVDHTAPRAVYQLGV